MKAPKLKGSRPITPPDLPAHLPSPLLLEAEIREGTHYAEVDFSAWDCSGQAAANLLIETALFDHSNLSRTVLRRLRLRDVRIVKSDLSNANWGSSELDRVEFIEGRLTGLQAPEAKFSDVKFIRCKADLARFGNATFRDVRFEDCILKDADFHGADLRGVSFKGCDVRGADFTAAKLDHADFRGARCEGLIMRPADLKGMIIDSNQALEMSSYFAQLLGVRVSDR